jgi:hypothetical protein
MFSDVSIWEEVVEEMVEEFAYRNTDDGYQARIHKALALKPYPRLILGLRIEGVK